MIFFRTQGWLKRVLHNATTTVELRLSVCTADFESGQDSCKFARNSGQLWRLWFWLSQAQYGKCWLMLILLFYKKYYNSFARSLINQRKNGKARCIKLWLYICTWQTMTAQFSSTFLVQFNSLRLAWLYILALIATT